MFDDIFGHENVKSILERVVQSKRISGAYLFAGPPSVGKYTIAREFAMELFGKQFKREIERNVFPDMLTVFPFLKKDLNANAGSYIDALREIAQSEDFTLPQLKGNESIPIDLVREIIIYAQKQAYIAGRKVIIITNAEKMRKEAANSFLKILEEPPADTVFILTTDNLNYILPTIISRCQLIKFGYLKEKDIAAYIESHTDSKVNAADIAWFFDGTLENADNACEAISGEDQNELIDLFINGDLYGTLDKMGYTGRKRTGSVEPAYYIKLIMRFLLDALMGRQGYFNSGNYANAVQSFSHKSMQLIFDELHTMENDLRRNIGAREIITRIISLAHAEKEVNNVRQS